MLNTNNPFEMFSLEPTYFIDEVKLRENYQALQKHFHPDNFANKTNQEKILATKISADLVSAYKTLLDPILRAVALINVNTLTDEAVFSLDDYISRDKTMLFEQMELREKLEQVQASALAELKVEFTDLLSQSEQQFAKLMAANSINSAKDSVLRMRYYQKLLAELALKENQELTWVYYKLPSPDRALNPTNPN